MFALWVLFCRNLTQRFQRRLSLFLSLIRATKVSTPRITKPEQPMQNEPQSSTPKKTKTNETHSQNSGANSKTNRGTGGKEEHDTSETPFSFHDFLPAERCAVLPQSRLTKSGHAFGTHERFAPESSLPTSTTCWEATSWQLSVAWHSLVPLGLLALAFSGSQPVPRDVFGHGIRGPITASRSAVSQPVHRDVFGHGIRGPITAPLTRCPRLASGTRPSRWAVSLPIPRDVFGHGIPGPTTAHSRGFRSH